MGAHRRPSANSTLLEFMGQLKDPATGDYEPPTALAATTYLPSLDKAVWEKSDRIVDVPLANKCQFPQRYSS